MRQTVFDDTNLSLFQQAINDQFSQVSKIPFMSGNFIQDIALSGTTTVNHGLGRQARGYFIASNNANVTIWNDAFSDDTSLTIYSSGAATVSIWVF